MTIYQRIKEVADSKNLPISQIEKALGFSNGSIRQWKDTVNSARLKKVADYLNVSMDYLMGDDIKTPKAMDLGDLSTIMMFDGKPIPEEDKELVRNILRRLRNDNK
ncbi:helix-turn-helix domain-containing protein [Fructilactobacillus cliffordii]|uniref:helix-turn-helix domain-containing protein n=1 Tax=Fructilactobacillus cliffordii TaxID=2940299 RepID=UPI002094016A|nr:helix-turn-helix transcriptional regulator [Fructilactobacillus cliffordii]USS86476.1 helix-turn-helix domain-containing protein [Fructilactobacillus cliffordii]